METTVYNQPGLHVRWQNPTTKMGALAKRGQDRLRHLIGVQVDKPQRV
jgi:hypothetical protein